MNNLDSASIFGAEFLVSFSKKIFIFVLLQNLNYGKYF